MLVLFLFSCKTSTKGYVLNQTRPLYPSIRSIDADYSEYKVILFNKEMEFQNYSISSDSKFKNISAFKIIDQGKYKKIKNIFECYSENEEKAICKYIVENNNNKEFLSTLNYIMDSTGNVLDTFPLGEFNSRKLNSQQIRRIEKFATRQNLK